MANNEDFLDLTGLSYFKGRLDRAFPSKDEFNALDKKVDEIISEGGEPNTIETISVNGTNVPPDANKNVDLDIPEEVFIAKPDVTSYTDIYNATTGGLPIFLGATPVIARASEPTKCELFAITSAEDNGQITGQLFKYTIDTSNKWKLDVLGNFALSADIPTDLSDLTNTGDDPYATESYVDENGGKIDSISVNGTTQTIDEHKNVDLDIPEGVLVAKWGVTPYTDLKAAYDSDTPIVIFMGSIEKTYLRPIAIDTETSNTIKILSIGYDYTSGDCGVVHCEVVGTTWTLISADDFARASDLPRDLSDLTNTGSDPYAQMSDVESAVVGALKPKGSVAFADLPQLTAANLNSMYNVTDEFTTTIDFVEGAGKTYPAGTNVAIINVGTDQNPVYKYDCYTGVMDLSGYWSKTELTAITAAQIDSLFE